jgi:hypothetical protein
MCIVCAEKAMATEELAELIKKQSKNTQHFQGGKSV